ncbi:MAG: hypothetical protein ABIO86_06475 [Sphingomonas sp.]
MENRSARRWIGGTIACLWLLSLVLPAAGWGSGPGAMGRGWSLLLIGWMGFINMQFGWFANVPFLLSMRAAIDRDRPPTRAFLVAGVMIALPAIQTLGWTEVQTDSGRFPVVIGPGYYLWLTALFAQSMWLISRALSAR